MNGHFEVNESAYPIGYLKGFEGYQVTDMRNLHALHSQPVSIDVAKSVAADINKDIRNGAQYLKDGHEQDLQDVVAAKLKEY